MLNDKQQMRSELLEWILKNLNAVYWAYDTASDKLLHISASCKKVFGFQPEDFYRRKKLLKKLIKDKDLQLLLNEKNKTFDSNSKILEYRIEDADGNERWLKTNVFKTCDRGKVTQLIGLVSEITDRKLLENNLMESKNKIEELHKIALQMESSKVEEVIYQLTIKAAEEILKFDTCSLDIVVGDRLVVKATSSGVIPEGVHDMSINEGLAGKTYREGRSFLLEDIRSANEAKPVQSTYRSAMSIPIGKFGVFQVISTKINTFDEEDLEMAELLISHTTAAIQRLRAEKDIRYLSFHDSLTSLYNRSFFEEELKRVDTKRQLPLSLIMIDLNGLKLVNDAFGHDKGDKLLKNAAEIICDNCRSEDVIARVGGDEFVILLPKTDSQLAEQIVDRIKNSCNSIDTLPIHLSMSLGFATKIDPEEDIQEVLRKAEEEMYNNKLQESRTARSNILSSLQETLWKRGRESKAHCERVEKLALDIGKSIGLSEEQLEDLSLLAFFHDIGRIVGKDEKHPEIGYRIARSTYQSAAVAESILSHHEKWDGSGYPRGLHKKEIPLLARLISLVDFYEKYCSEKKVSEQEARKIISQFAGKSFDPELVEVLKSL